MKKVLALIFASLLLVPCFIGCAGDNGELRHVTLNEVTRSVFYAPLYAAAGLGYFADEGIELEIVTGGGSDKSMTALIAGEAEFALMGPETGVYVVNEGSSEHPVVIGQLTKRDGSFLIGREPTDRFSWEDLRGKSVIGGRPGGMPFMTLNYVLRKNGLVPGEDVEVISNVQFNLMGGAFEGGTGDYVTLFEPTATLFERAGSGYIVANIGLESGEVPYTAFMTMPDTVKKDPGLVEAFVRAVYRGQQFVWNASDSEIAEAMRSFFPDADTETLALVAKNYRETDSWMKTPVMTEDAFTRLQDIMETNGELSKRVGFTELIDNSFAEKAVRELGK
ncbi:MAG: ABC transporter substrate-binding protein [Clostridia bacterium]|nr:ABC transporter substrate-binding protein [Clostridia bacterium]